MSPADASACSSIHHLPAATVNLGQVARKGAGEEEGRISAVWKVKGLPDADKGVESTRTWKRKRPESCEPARPNHRPTQVSLKSVKDLSHTLLP